ncbi:MULTISPECIES: hypothetical protein [Butyricimonas]|uniref:hypothetical protein n=1 Tax=Butyricimonas TaxID=574697 RepID=UPI001D08D570|nr:MULTISPECIES: hypothetical protein [Butyricimonas]MCB6971839.1 hypothetical protein [Butyricimonas synergistica]MCG4518847.1 hypothetical protein [Butyricimonas sp. DFI.6.44]
MKNVFIDVQELIKTVPGIRYVGEDWGQLNFSQPPVDFPCVLIDLGEAEFSQAGQNTQQVIATLNVTIADIRYNGVSARLPIKQQEREFEIFSLIENVNKKLHGHGGETYSRLMRISLKNMLREDAVREFVMTYKFAYTDMTGESNLTKYPVSPKIKIYVEKSIR